MRLYKRDCSCRHILWLLSAANFDYDLTATVGGQRSLLFKVECCFV